MSIEFAVTALGMATAFLGIYLVRRFVQSAPLERLKAPPPPERGGEGFPSDDSVAR